MSQQKRAGRPSYPAEMRDRAVRMVFDHQGEYPSQWKAIESPRPSSMWRSTKWVATLNT